MVKVSPIFFGFSRDHNMCLVTKEHFEKSTVIPSKQIHIYT